MGVELGYGYRGPYADRAAMHGVHVGPFLSVGLGSLGAHWILPIAASGAGEEQGTEFAVTVALKFFYPVFGEVYNMRFGSGLPLHQGAEARVASQRPSAEWLEGSVSIGAQPSSAPLSAPLRGWLAERWLADALDEHAAVAAFARLRSRCSAPALRFSWSRPLNAQRSTKSATPSSASRSPNRTRTRRWGRMYYREC